MTQHVIAEASATARITQVVVNSARCLSDFPNRTDSSNVQNMAEAAAETASWPDYAATPLDHLPELAAFLGVRDVLYKDVTALFGLGSFKSLGVPMPYLF